MSGHPLQKGPGMEYFNKDHWQKKVEDVACADQKYSHNEMGQADDYKKSSDGLAAYVKSHKQKH